MRKGYVLYITMSLMSFSFVACKSSEERGLRFYEDATKYTVGEFISENERVKCVEIDWLAGSVEIEQSSSAKISVSEEENNLAEEKCLHTYLNEGVLRIKYCRSGYVGNIDKTQKNLQVDIPVGIDLKINGVSVNVYLGMLELGELSVETDTGCIEGESILCQSAEMKTGSGYIGIGALTAKKAELESVSGDIHLGMPLCQRTEIETKRGEVALYLRGEVAALVAFTTQSGVLKTERTYTRTKNGYLFDVDEKNMQKIEPIKIFVKTEKGNLRVE